MNACASTFNLDPFAGIAMPVFEDFDPHTFFQLDKPFDFMEAATGTTKKNIFQKLWSIIRKGVSFIINALKTIARGIKTFLVGGGEMADEIAQDIGLGRRQFSNIAAKRELSDDEDKLAKKAADSIIKAINKDGSIEINPAALVQAGGKDVAIKGKTVNAGGARAAEVIKLMQNPAPLDLYEDFFTKLTSETRNKEINAKLIENMAEICKGFLGLPTYTQYGVDGFMQHGQSFAKKIPKGSKALRFMKKYGIGDGGGYVQQGLRGVTIKMDDLLAFQQRIDKICKLGEEFDNYYKQLNLDKVDVYKMAPNKFEGQTPGEIVEKSYMQILNDLAWICVNLQGGIHAIAQGLSGVYDVSEKYRDTVDDPNILARFVERLIRAGIPGKYVVSNVYMVCTEKLKGHPKTDEAGHVSKPIMGFGRLTLLPDGDTIYKIAINRYGVRSNKNDFIVLNTVKKIEDPQFQDLFADTLRTYGEYTVNVMEKVNAGKKYEPSQSEAKTLGDKINDTFRANGINLRIVDIKSDAFGQRNGRPVIVDYGYINRTAAAAQD